MFRKLSVVLLAVAQISGAMPRNPFQPLVTPCDALAARLAKWQLYGVVSSATGAIAIMQDPHKRWRRIATGMDAEPGTPVNEITPRFLSVTLPEACGQTTFTWTIKGVNHDMDANAGSAGGMAAGGPGR